MGLMPSHIETMTKRLIPALLALGLASHAQAHEAAPGAKYLGNEGVLVTHGDTKVVFDAFYNDGYGTYTLVPDAIRSAMLAGTAPYDGIDAVFVSHVHVDHFSAAPAVAFLRAHPDVLLYGTRQGYVAIVAETGADDPVLSRIVTADLTPTDPAKTYQVDGLQIEVVAIPHAGQRSRGTIRNLSWRVTLDDDTTVVHLGDAGTVAADFVQHADHFAARRADAAFLPHWFLDDDAGKAILDTHIQADRVIGIHVPAAATGQGDQWRERAGGDLFTDPGETRALD
jgi:L-ascorbate metabolism protein UlaG (beta-lactamase superfamily)